MLCTAVQGVDRRPLPIATKGGVVQELDAQATLGRPSGHRRRPHDDDRADRDRGRLEDEAPPQLELDVRRGADTQTFAITWTRDDLERLLRRRLRSGHAHLRPRDDRAGIHRRRGPRAERQGRSHRRRGLRRSGPRRRRLGDADGRGERPRRHSPPYASPTRPRAASTRGSSTSQSRRARRPRAANPKAGQDPWQYNVGTRAAHPAAANPKATRTRGSTTSAPRRTSPPRRPEGGHGPWQYNLASDSSLRGLGFR